MKAEISDASKKRRFFGVKNIKFYELNMKSGISIVVIKNGRKSLSYLHQLLFCGNFLIGKIVFITDVN